MRKNKSLQTLGKVLTVLLTFCLILSFAPAVFAEDATSGTCGENVTWTLDTETGVLTISGTGDMEEFASRSEIPWYSQRESVTSIVITEGVTSIGMGAFIECNLTTMVIPDSVTSIGDYAFQSCDNLENVTIGNGVTTIGYAAFLYCSGLTGIVIPDSVISIGDYSFAFCDSLTDVVISDSVTSIGESVFEDCVSLESVSIPDSVTSIGDYAFEGCSSLTEIVVSADNETYCSEDGILFSKDKTVLICYPGGKETASYVIPENVIILANGAFSKCENLTSITMGNSVTSIGEYVFYECSNLTDVTIGDNVTSIDEGAFEYCSSLVNVTIGSNVASIGYAAFSDCSSLTNVTIPDSVTSMGDYVFEACSSLTSVTIGSGVTSIGEYPFIRCTSLSGILVSADNAAYCSEDGILFSKDMTELTCYPAGKEGTSYEIPESVTSVGNCAFSWCESLTSVTIPDSVTSIGHDAFWKCSGLTSMTIPGAVTSIEDWTFEDCSSLASIVIPDSVTLIGEGAFTGCDSLGDVYYSGSESDWEAIEIEEDNDPLLAAAIHYNSIGSEYSGTCGENVTWTLDVTTEVLTISGTGDMEDYDSSNDVPWYSLRKSITSIVITDGVTSVGRAAFIECSITAAVIPDSVTSIGDYAFEYCDDLENVTIGNGVITIGYAAFADCSSLSEIVVAADNPAYCSESGILFSKDKTELVCYPAGKTVAFYKIPRSVTSIDDYAFEKCESLVSVYIPGSVTHIGKYAFDYCTSLTAVMIPSSVTSIEDYVFANCTSLASVVIPKSVTSIGDGAFYSCESLGNVYYGGSKSDWAAIETGEENEFLLNANIHYLSISSVISSMESWTCGEIISGTGKWTSFNLWGIRCGNLSTVLSLPTMSPLLHR